MRCPVSVVIPGLEEIDAIVRDDLQSDASVVLDPVTEVFPELVLKDAVPTSCDDDGRPP